MPANSDEVGSRQSKREGPFDALCRTQTRPPSTFNVVASYSRLWTTVTTMAILNWFRKVRDEAASVLQIRSHFYKQQKEPEDYDQILSSLALDIQKRQAKLADIRLRERRTTTLVTLYAISAWVTYIGAWYLGLLPQVIAGYGGSASFVKWLPIFLGPIL